MIRVLGLGNVLMGDDGFGPHVVRVLEAEYGFPEDVSLVDLGTPGLDLLPYLAGARAIVLVDTVNAPGVPGELRLYRKEQILRHLPAQRLGPHDPGVKQTLLTLEFSGACPADVFLIGVIPKTVEAGPGLSDPVRGAVPWAIREILRELDRLGAGGWRRLLPREPDLWWEAGAAPALAGRQ
jgi:hydrogenase maturation protease